MAAQLASMRGSINSVVRAIYPDTEIDGQVPVAQSAINATYYAHRAAATRDYVQRSVYLQLNWTLQSTHQAEWIAWLINEMRDRNWWTVQRPGEAFRRKALVLFDPVSINADATGKANWLAMKAAIEAVHGPLYAIGVGGISTSAWTALGLVGGTSYDGALGASPGANGQHSSADQEAKDHNNTGSVGFAPITTVNLWNDGRVRRAENAVAWSDTPTIPDAITRFAYGLAPGIEVCFVGGPATELGEAGPCLPTVQDGRTRCGYDQIDWQRGTPKPASYTYVIDARTLYWSRSGWATRTTAVAGAYDDDYLESSTPGDSITLTCDAHVLGAASSGSIEILCPKGAGLGVIDVLKNGVSQGTVSLAGSTAQQQSVKTVVVAAGDTLSVVVSSGTCRFDAGRVTYAP